MPACADLNGAMRKLPSTTFMTSDQHKEVTKARKARDDKDSYAVLGFLQERKPRVPDPFLQNIATDVIDKEDTNFDEGDECPGV